MLEYDQSLDSEFSELNNLGYVLIEFYADWCGTCRAVTRMLKYLDTLNKISIVRVDIEKNKSFIQKYHIIGVPVVMLMYHGNEVQRIGGSLNYEEFKEWIHLVEAFKELS